MTTPETVKEVVWSTQQEAIFNWFANGKNHVVVYARAGTGKTTVIIEGVKRAPERAILICAFSKIIQQELQKRIAMCGACAGKGCGVCNNSGVVTGYGHITASTLHSVGYSCVRLFLERVRVEFTSERADNLAEKVCGIAAPVAIKKLVSKLHTKGREIKPHATKLGDLTALAITFECEPDESWAAAGFTLDYVEQKALDAMELASKVKTNDLIDGSDMIFLPVRNGWLMPKYDLVVVDEAQDMTTAQLEIAQGVLRPGGRIAVVGDDRQAIFGFRGADSESLGRLKAELSADELGLTTTYRCGRAIVALAQDFVPDFGAGPSNPEGAIEAANLEKLLTMAGPGDFILSRVNAPLVSIAMKLLRAGKRTRIAGRDIGAGLLSLIRKFKGSSVPNLLGKIETWRDKESTRVRSQIEKATNGRKSALTAKLEAIADQADMLVSLTDGAKSVREVEDRITALFTDDGLGALGMITCSSVHRSKGLEANRVFILQETLRTSTLEEQNICYVAITRAKQTLVWVS